MPSKQVFMMKLFLALINLLERHPRWVRLFLRPIANAPIVGPRLPVLFRAYMGATAFEIHDVDLALGRINIGGVEEIMAGSKLIELLHTILGDRLGEEEKNEALYELGFQLCCWEVGQALEGNRWAPSALVPLIKRSELLTEVQNDPLLARFFERVMEMMSRLITDEGGWGHLEIDAGSFPLRVTLSNSQEATWFDGANEPICYLYAGIVAGYASTISGERLTAREVACKATGAPRCVFEVRR